MSRLLARWQAYWPLPLRAAIGGALAVAGGFKVFSGLGHRNIASELLALGLPAPEFMAWVVGAAELLCGLALLAGAKTAWSAVIMLLNLGGLVVIALARGIEFPEALALPGLGFPYRFPSYEAAAVLIAGLLALLIGGPGPCSVDHYFGNCSAKSISRFFPHQTLPR